MRLSCLNLHLPSIRLASQTLPFFFGLTQAVRSGLFVACPPCDGGNLIAFSIPAPPLLKFPTPNGRFFNLPPLFPFSLRLLSTRFLTRRREVLFISVVADAPACRIFFLLNYFLIFFASTSCFLGRERVQEIFRVRRLFPLEASRRIPHR